MDSINDVLEAAKEYCRDHTSDATFEYYIKPIKAVSFENSNTVTLEIRNAFTLGIVADRYTVLLKEAFKSVLGFDVEIAFVTPQPEEEKITGEQALKELRERQLPSGRYAFTFENFIKGPSNQLPMRRRRRWRPTPRARTTRCSSTGRRAWARTHLLNAIQVEIKKNHPDYNIVYVDCEMFTTRSSPPSKPRRPNSSARNTARRTCC